MMIYFFLILPLLMNFVLDLLNSTFWNLIFYYALHSLIYDNNFVFFLFYGSFYNLWFSYIRFLSLLIYIGISFRGFCMIFLLTLLALYDIMRKFFLIIPFLFYLFCISLNTICSLVCIYTYPEMSHISIFQLYLII